MAETKFNGAQIMTGADISINTGGAAAQNILVILDDYTINSKAANGVGIATGATTAGTTTSAGGATSGALGFAINDMRQLSLHQRQLMRTSKPPHKHSCQVLKSVTGY